MKSRFKSLLFTISVVIISSCGGSKNEDAVSGAASTNMSKAALSAGSCEVCNQNDEYTISLDSVIYLIQAFDSAFIRNRLVANAGGVLDFDSAVFNVDPTNSTSYNAFKLHWAFGGQNRLSVTCELSPKNCTNNVYQGADGVEGPVLNTSSVQNDFTLKTSLTDTLKKIEILRHLASDRAFAMSQPGAVLIDTTVADSLLNLFKNASGSLSNAYQGCDDIVYNKKLTYDKIVSTTNRNAIRYYFGYDARTNVKFKLRLILVAIDAAGHLVIYDASDNLLIRENSRPRP